MSFWGKLVQKFIPSASPDEGKPDRPSPTPSTGASKFFRSFMPREVQEEIDWEALLIEADLGLELTTQLVGKLSQARLLKKPAEAESLIRGELSRIVTAPVSAPQCTDKLEVILLVGVNGSGKTTTAAKLAAQAVAQGRSVCLAAADTFRAAAVDQLQVWGERLRIPVISAPAGTDPASVVYTAYESAEKAGADLLIVDTAGRLPNKNNLMLEIAKVKRTIQKKNPSAPHQIWLVVDGTTGNNILLQAQEFHQALHLTGLIMTKLDSSAKGGMIAAVLNDLRIPTLYLGRGESVEDLTPFDPERYVEEFFGS